jgi:hypothetical protein
LRDDRKGTLDRHLMILNNKAARSQTARRVGGL